MSVPNLLSNNSFTLEPNYDGHANAWLLAKQVTASWQTLLESSVPLIQTEISEWEYQILTAPTRNIHFGILYADETTPLPFDWTKTTNNWMGEIENKNGWTGICIDPLNSSNNYKVWTYNSQYKEGRPICRTPPALLNVGDRIRFQYHPAEGTIWISLSTENYDRRYLFATGLLGKKIFPAVSMYYIGDTIVYYPLNVHVA